MRAANVDQIFREDFRLETFATRLGQLSPNAMKNLLLKIYIAYLLILLLV